MILKDQLGEDMKTVFLNENEFAYPLRVDGVTTRCILSQESGAYDEGLRKIVLSLDVAITESSRVIIDEKTYSVLSIRLCSSGQKDVVLGEPL